MKTPVLLAAALLALATLASAAQDADKVKAELRKKFPEATVDSVSKVPYGGLYEVVGGGEIFYTDEKASFIVAGPIIDLVTKQNVTEQRMRVVNRIRFDTLPLDSAIKIVRGNGSRKLAMFEDPNCPYCKRFERDLQGVTDITVYVFLYPILSADSVEKSKVIWCSTDRAKSWLDIMVRDKAVSGDDKCATPIDRNLALGQSKRIRGTPTLVFEDGDRIPGVMPIAALEKKLTDAKGGASAKTEASTR